MFGGAGNQVTYQPALSLFLTPGDKSDELALIDAVHAGTI